MSFAATLLVKAPNANPHDFFVYAQNNEVEKISSHFLKCEESIGLQQTLKEAQYHFLNGSLEKSRLLFSDIAARKWNCDWKEQERKTIAFSFYRLAQLSKNEMEQIQFLTDAINFDETSAPDNSIFPPPTVRLYKNLKAQLKKKSFSFPAFTKNYSYVLRNGQFINLATPELETFSLRARYTFVSDAYKIETLTVTAEELMGHDLKPQPWVSGNCKNPILSDEISPAKEGLKIFYEDACIADLTAKTTSPLQNITAQASMAGPSEAIPANLAVAEKKSWLQRNYLWVGAVVGVALIANQMRHNNESHQTVVVPTATSQ
jgi:hypothetical protein